MSGKIEISRELADRLCVVRTTAKGWITSADAIIELRKILAAPVVERQPAAWLVQWNSILPGITGHREVVLVQPFFSPGAATVTPLYTSPPALVASEPMVSLSDHKKALAAYAEHIEMLKKQLAEKPAPVAVVPEERAEFEAWGTKSFGFGPGYYVRDGDEYINCAIQCYWAVWQARANLDKAKESNP